MAASHRIHSTAQDAEIFARFLEGDDAAFVQLFDRYDRGLRLYALKIVGAQQVAEDLTQELWERVIRMRSESKVIAEPARYLMRMARNLCLKHLRDRRLASSLDDISEGDHPSVSMPEQSHMEELVVIALAKLPFDQREILVLHNYCGYSYEDIAQLRGDTLGSVKMRALRGRSRIGRIITAYLALGKESEGSTQPDTDSEIFTGEEQR
jgi:RNA polymerase sigma-70 factor (ECF subfamily)